MTSINCKGKLIDLSTPVAMGIVNITPDSFYDGGVYKSDIEILKQVEKMLTEGATFIDIGGYSSRPNAAIIDEVEELKRIVPAVELVLKEFPDCLISIDTYRSTIAQKCLELGAALINDISAGSLDNKMYKTVAKYQVPYIIMHMQGTPQDMQKNPTYEDVTQELLFYFSKKIAELRAMNINDIILDVGFGFGKSMAHNYQLLGNLELFKALDVPILSGLSRKSMLYKLLETDAQHVLNATTAANTIALLKGSSILRVHDVKEAMEAIKIVEASLR